ncbi:Catalytic LigB subunit of aromatic ring-opening dioxygenase [Phytophthora infestans]|uniref:Catalytic LigB subunit of aromatic ring-opening dioxygenase n=1 Tax=Phytophthora infestans TaxID=4787 RepID=A0A833WHJ4_PHYIN|nr:Catalytic LigB subunit of aromatic ring-opening dioxygenase [Phytophthora infestans]
MYPPSSPSRMLRIRDRPPRHGLRLLRLPYDIVYPAKGDPVFAQHVKEQLENNKIKAKLVYRGYDHGVFVPMKLIRPQADIPIVTMSIDSYLTNQDHFNLGKTLTLASDSKLSVEERTNAPVAKYEHPSPDHFMTFVVTAGAGMEDKEPGARALFGGWALDHMSFANYA